jgi:hypothetical protein
VVLFADHLLAVIGIQRKFGKSILMRPALVLLAVLVIAGCKKDKFTTTPQLKVKSVNSKNISGNDVIRIRLRLTDKEGDFSRFFAIKKTVKGCPTSNFTDSSSLFSIPLDFINQKKKEGEVEITLTRLQRGGNTCSAPGGGVKPDTAVFSFWTRDQAGNKSDTAFTDPIIIRN